MVCYICNEDSSTIPLIESPCQQCHLRVHVQCFDTYQKHLFESFKCVLINTGEDGAPLAVYTSCSICKKRFEYSSPALIQTLIHRLQHPLSAYSPVTMPSTTTTTRNEQLVPSAATRGNADADADEEDDMHRDVQLIVRCLTDALRMIPQHVQTDALACVQKIMRAISRAPLDTIVSYIDKTIQYARVGVVLMTACGVVLGARAVQYVFF